MRLKTKVLEKSTWYIRVNIYYTPNILSIEQKLRICRKLKNIKGVLTATVNTTHPLLCVHLRTEFPTYNDLIYLLSEFMRTEKEF